MSGQVSPTLSWGRVSNLPRQRGREEVRAFKPGARSARYVLNEDGRPLVRYLDVLTKKIGGCDQSEAIWIMRMKTTAVVIMIMMALTCVRFFLHSEIFSVHQQGETN